MQSDQERRAKSHRLATGAKRSVDFLLVKPPVHQRAGRVRVAAAAGRPAELVAPGSRIPGAGASVPGGVDREGRELQHRRAVRQLIAWRWSRVPRSLLRTPGATRVIGPGLCLPGRAGHHPLLKIGEGVGVSARIHRHRASGCTTLVSASIIGRPVGVSSPNNRGPDANHGHAYEDDECAAHQNSSNRSSMRCT